MWPIRMNSGPALPYILRNLLYCFTGMLQGEFLAILYSVWVIGESNTLFVETSYGVYGKCGLSIKRAWDQHYQTMLTPFFVDDTKL